jgi:predicted phage tail protein
MRLMLAAMLCVAPPSVTDLTVTGTSPTGVTLQWTVPSDAYCFDVRCSLSPILSDEDFDAAKYVPGVLQAEGEGELQSMTILGLTSSTTYYCAMKVVDKAGDCSPLSNVVTATTLPPDLTPPDAVDNLAGEGLGWASASLKWTTPADGVLYDLRLSTKPITDDAEYAGATPVSGEPAPGAEGVTSAMIVTGLEAATTYYFALKVADSYFNWSGLSNEATVTTGEMTDVVPPAAVTDLTVTVATTSMLGLSWTAPSDATRTDVRWSASPIMGDAEFASAAAVPGTAVNGLPAGATYYFAMKTADSDGNWSDLSNLAIGKTLPAPTAKSSKTSKCGLLGMELVLLIAFLRLRGRRSNA